MLLLKKIDAYVQVVLIVAFVIIMTTLSEHIYFTLGCWQVLSALIHLIAFRKIPVVKGRKWYLFALLLLLIMGSFSLEFSPWDPIDFGIFTLPFLGVLGFVSPFLAILYCVISFREIKLFEQHQVPEITESV